MAQEDSGQKGHRRKLRGLVARILLVAVVGVLAVGTAFAVRPISYMLADTVWLVGETQSSVPLD